MAELGKERGAQAEHGSGSANAEKAARPRKKQVRFSREVTTERILDAAEELFSHRDPKSVTMREIAERAGVTHALVHQYLGTKDDVLTAVVVRAAPDRTRMIAQDPDVHTVFPRLFNDVVATRAHTRLMIRSALDGVEYASLDDRITTGRAMLSLSASAKASGVHRLPTPDAVDPRIALTAAVALVYGWVALDAWLVKLFDLEGEDPDFVRERLAEVFTYVTDLALTTGDDSGSATK